MDEWRSLRLAIQSALLGLGSVAGIVVLCWVRPELRPLKYPVVIAITLAAVGVIAALRKPAPMIGLRRREEMVMLLAHLAMLAFGLVFLASLGLQRVSPGWMWALILLCALISLYALAISLLARGVLVGRRAYYEGRCTRCLYDLTAIESATCPECGRAVTVLRTEATGAPGR